MNTGPKFAALLGCAVVACGSAAAAQPVSSTRESLQALTEVADIEALALSPDGRNVAFRVQRPSVELNTYTVDWYVAELATGAVRKVADGGDAIYNNGVIEFEAPVWSPDSRAFFFRALVGGAIAIWRATPDGSGRSQVIGGEADIESFAVGEDGRSATNVTGPARAVVRAAEQKEYDDGILIDATIDTRQGLYRAAYSHGRLGTQRLIGSWYRRDGLLWREPRTRHSLDLTTTRDTVVGKVEVHSGIGGPAPEALRATSESGSVAVVSGDGTEAGLTLSVKLPGGSNVVCSDPVCRSGTIAALAWRPGRQQVLLTKQDPAFRQTLHLFDPATRRARLVLRGDGLLSGGRANRTPCAVSARYAICVAAAAASPPRLVRIDFDKARPVTLYDPNLALRAATPPTVEHLSIPYGDGARAAGVLLTPRRRHGERLPLFIMYYHCPGFLRGGMGDEFPFGPMTDAGFAVVCLTYGPMKTADTAIDNYEAAQASIEAVVSSLDRRGLIDPQRIGMGGLSFGSEVTMWMAMKTRLLAAAAIASPQPSPSGFWQVAIRGRDAPEQYRTRWKAGSPDDDPAGWRRISPEMNVPRIKAPLLMQLPEQEIASAMQFYARMTNTTTPVELYAFPNESHLKLQPRHRYAVYRRNLDWFRYWLQGYREPDPATDAQYRRWDALKARKTGSVE